MAFKIMRLIFIFVGVVFSSLILAQDGNSIVDQVELVIFTDQSSFTLFFSHEQLTGDEVASLADLGYQIGDDDGNYTSPTPLSIFPNFSGINLSHISDTLCLRIENTERGETPTPVDCRQTDVNIILEFVTSVDSFWYDTDHNVYRPIIISNAYTDQACPATDRACDITYNITEDAPPQTDITDADIVQVIVDYAISRSGPNTDYPIIENVRLVAGDELELTGQYVDVLTNQHWLKGSLPEAQEEFWIFAGNVEVIPDESNNSVQPIPTIIEVDPPPKPPDEDSDGIPDPIDACPRVGDAGNGIDRNGCPLDPDVDDDGITNSGDNCPTVPNPAQADTDEDGLGDACDADRDADGVINTSDNCPNMPNRNQLDIDGDGDGNACDNDRDGDGVINISDNCPDEPNLSQVDSDSDDLGDSCDPTPKGVDSDRDGVIDTSDNCPTLPNPAQLNLDSDGFGDACDPDKDGDGVLNATDNCPSGTNPSQADLDEDNLGDLCDTDRDGDGIPNTSDTCPVVAGPVTNNGCPLQDCQVTPLNAAGANLRSGPATCYAQTGSLGQGNQMTVVGYARSNDTTDSASWWQLNTGQWVREFSVTEIGSCVAVPSVASPPVCPTPEIDSDDDGIPDSSDNCPLTPNPDQADNNGVDDGFGRGDACENDPPPCPEYENDSDCDTVVNSQDVCLGIAGLTNNDGCPEPVITVNEGSYSFLVPISVSGYLKSDPTIVVVAPNNMGFNWSFNGGGGYWSQNVQLGEDAKSSCGGTFTIEVYTPVSSKSVTVQKNPCPC